MAYVGATPWHGLGNRLAPRQPLEVWATQAGMDWSICAAPVRYQAPARDEQELLSFEDQQVLYRSDTHLALSVVGARYQIVQPLDALAFFRDLTEAADFELESAGTLKEGRRFWALARTGKETALMGSDSVRGYVLLASSCDGTLATTATPTSIRVVCNNTLAMALRDTEAAIKVSHRTVFDAQKVKRQMGLLVSQWDGFMLQMRELAQRKVLDQEASKFIRLVLAPATMSQDAGAIGRQERAMKHVQALFDGQGKGAELQASKGTAWGLVNAVTEFVDHHRRARSNAYRLDSAWFGQGAVIKERALSQALQLVA
ncbi:DUF932 domain-containing protein [Pelomonas sp. CA6]|uniref:DUF932 domain-containing protein n=1 Tax=Pelomonas sp. CA6 TaxID=2907999 RepID=UPI0035A90795